MRSLAGTAAVVLVLAASSAVAQPAQPASAGTGRISGRVVAADTGKPIRWAVVRMVTQQGRQVPVRTDAQGRFDFTALPAGRYVLDVRAERYVAMMFGGQPYDGRLRGKPIDLTDGEQFTKADFALPRAGAIEGRLLDEFGDPAPNVAVRLSRLEYAAGRRRLMPVSTVRNPLPSDDRGHFRVYGLQPGDYYVSALSGVFTDKNEAGGFAPTYYPGTSDVTAAERVRLAAGREVTGLTIPLVPAKMASISGRMVDAGGKPIDKGNLSLMLSDRLGMSDFIFWRGLTDGDGSFMLRNVPPGSYTLQGFGRPVAKAGNLGAFEFGWLGVTVDGVDRRDLVLSVRKGPSLRGRIVLEEVGGPPLKPSEVMVSPIPIEFDSAPQGGGPSPFTMRDDWTFEVGNLSGRRLIRVGTRSPEWNLKRITQGASDITDTAVDFTKDDVKDVEVVLTSRAPVLSGGVVDERGNPVADYNVVIFAADSAKWTDRSRFLALGRPNQEGRFRVTGLPPEDYFAIALSFVGSGEGEDPEFLEKLRPFATSLSLSEGEVKTLQVKLSKRPE